MGPDSLVVVVSQLKSIPDVNVLTDWRMFWASVAVAGWAAVQVWVLWVTANRANKAQAALAVEAIKVQNAIASQANASQAASLSIQEELAGLARRQLDFQRSNERAAFFKETMQLLFEMRAAKAGELTALSTEIVCRVALVHHLFGENEVTEAFGRILTAAIQIGKEYDYADRHEGDPFKALSDARNAFVKAYYETTEIGF